MKVDYDRYVPCLRWKQGEYQALYRLDSSTKRSICPIIEVAEIGYDFETGSESKTIDEHLEKFAQRVRTKWGNSKCFVDMHLVDPSERMRTGQHPLSFVFNDLRNQGVNAIPVIDLKQDSFCQDAVMETVSVDKRGVCARIGIEEIANDKLKYSLDKLLEKYQIKNTECDFTLDLGAPNFVPLDGFASLLIELIRGIPYLDKWRSFILLGTSFPKSMAEVPRGLSTKPRNEWLLYKLLYRTLNKKEIRIPMFGDYAINHPNVIRLDMRFIKPCASVRYTIDNDYLIAKGQNVRDFGYPQYRDLCSDVINSEYFYDEAFSEGDKYINDCAHGLVSTGKLTTWRWVGTNHHLEKVLNDLSSFYVS
jgi:hypothetical protein